jgi:hypothetical protein
MHWAATFAVHFAWAVTVAFSAHATFASTLHVAPHDAVHLLAQDPSVCVLHWELHASLHWAAHLFAQSAESTAPAQSARQSLPHCELHVEPQSDWEFAMHWMLQSDPQSVRQFPVAAASHSVFSTAPRSPWQIDVVSIWAHANGHWSFATITQFALSACCEVPVTTVVGSHPKNENDDARPRIANGGNTLTMNRLIFIGNLP